MYSGQQTRPYTEKIPFPVPDVDPSHWYAIQTRARHEKKVASQLQEKRVTTFLPLIARVHRWSDRHKMVHIPLFPGYTFVQMAPSEEAKLAVLRTPGVLSFVGINGREIPIPDKQIEDVRKLVNSDAGCAPYPYLRVGQRVRVRGGSLDGLEGFLVAVGANRSVIVSIDLFRRSVAVRIDGSDVALI